MPLSSQLGLLTHYLQLRHSLARTLTPAVTLPFLGGYNFSRRTTLRLLWNCQLPPDRLRFDGSQAAAAALCLPDMGRTSTRLAKWKVANLHTGTTRVWKPRLVSCKVTQPPD